MQNICYNIETHIVSKKSSGFARHNNIAFSRWESSIIIFPIFQVTSSGDKNI